MTAVSRIKSQPPVKRVVCTRAKSPLIPASVSRRWLSLCSSLLPLSLLPPLKGRSYYLLPLKGSWYSRTLSLSNAISCFSWSSIYFLIVLSLSPTVDTSCFLRLFLLPCTCTAFGLFPVGLLGTDCRLSSFYTSDRTRCDTYTATWYAPDCSFGLPYISPFFVQ